ncbi:uncharacterized protein LOC127100597 [Lathyrus oleraceus]|uniref:uncharacterized protein LOC127100597 n=1 Tax=Pisum sativum TaxID=3888 RepID=UPI0021D33A77|nr:uncharacterized protein LOC127100597 [Pisum sativum]
MDPIKYIFEKPALTSRVDRWQMTLTEYDIQHVTQKAVKGSVLSDYLAHQPLEDYQSMRFEFPDEDIMLIRDYNIPDSEEGPEPGSWWTLVFDGASNTQGNNIGSVIISPTGFHLPFTTRLCFEYTNNMEKCEACIFDIEAAIGLNIKIFEVYRDSALVINKVKGEWEARVIPYFNEITFHHIPREENQFADALTTLSSMFKVKWKESTNFPP